ncbi:hypothetical protein [Paenibacillus lentus]|uniref:MotA/TolQ/ExbB proton channel domain-containing protein n=1 Tax=Paenibacillus lentus TaxID=1338368 RepID=A0A3Q8S5B5_9BACL|nr:hypothetical protein [Paenibacillus lentus]AZK47234.1 hypothetical protein EIM92_14590 [Paenibacillus lentus]
MQLFHWYEIIVALIFIFLIAVDWYLFRRFEKDLQTPFKNLKINEKNIFSDYKITDTLYQSYKQLSPGKFKIVKLSVKSHDINNNPLTQIIDVFLKLVLTLLLTVMGVSVTIFVALLSFLNTNTELKKDSFSWYKNVQDILDALKNGTSAYLTVSFIGIVLFGVAMNHILLSHKRKTLYKRHLTVIEEIEKERS